MSRKLWVATRLLSGAAILAVLLWRVGTGPFLTGLRAVDGSAVAAAAGIAVVTTVAAAWRWTLIARGLGVGLPLSTAVAAYYRSQFLNTALPGGVLGDVHRGVRHGRDVGDVGRGLRAVAWERAAGQVVQMTLALVVLLVFPSPARAAMPIVAVALVVLLLGAAVLVRARAQGGTSRRARALRAAAHDIRDGVAARRTWPGVTLGSAVVVVGHTATFLIAARTAGATASLTLLLPLALLVLLAMAVPANVGGWGPREGVAAWAFGAAGLGADRGVAVATVYGVLVIAASLPGAAVLVVAWWRRAQHREPPAAEQHAVRIPEGAARG